MDLQENWYSLKRKTHQERTNERKIDGRRDKVITYERLKKKELKKVRIEVKMRMSKRVRMKENRTREMEKYKRRENT